MQASVRAPSGEWDRAPGPLRGVRRHRAWGRRDQRQRRRGRGVDAARRARRDVAPRRPGGRAPRGDRRVDGAGHDLRPGALRRPARRGRRRRGRRDRGLGGPARADGPRRPAGDDVTGRHRRLGRGGGHRAARPGRPRAPGRRPRWDRARPVGLQRRREARGDPPAGRGVRPGGGPGGGAPRATGRPSPSIPAAALSTSRTSTSTAPTGTRASRSAPRSLATVVSGRTLPLVGLGVDGDGDATLAWSLPGATRPVVRVAERPAGGSPPGIGCSFHPSRTLTVTGGPAVADDLALSAAGAAAIALFRGPSVLVLTRGPDADARWRGGAGAGAGAAGRCPRPTSPWTPPGARRSCGATASRACGPPTSPRPPGNRAAHPARSPREPAHRPGGRPPGGGGEGPADPAHVRRNRRRGITVVRLAPGLRVARAGARAAPAVGSGSARPSSW